jgi:hypothetical protein
MRQGSQQFSGDFGWLWGNRGNEYGIVDALLGAGRKPKKDPVYSTEANLRRARESKRERAS